jgi:proline iminopeptidase
MRERYPAIEPQQHGMLATGDGHDVYWEVCGNPAGKPALVLHGGPGSGCKPWHRQMFDPERYRVVLLDQRGCGRSTPGAGTDLAALEANTTTHLLDDIEAVRDLLGIDRWLVWGGSFGCELALAYAERYPARVSELVLWGITTGRRSEADWLFRGGVGVMFPEQWYRFAAAAGDDDPVAGYRRLLQDPDPAVHRKAAEDWCAWESVTPDWPPANGIAERFRDPAFALGFARLVTHYVHHDLWIEDGSLLRDAVRLAGVPAMLIHGRFDLQAPLASAWDLHLALPDATLDVVGEGGHAAGGTEMRNRLIAATDRFAGV